MSDASRPLAGKIALVAGATRGAGRGIAVELGHAGATVWCTGRSVTGHTPEGRPETLQQTAAMVTAAGGDGRWMRVDHTERAAVAALARRIEDEHGGVDILVNDIWGGDALTHWGRVWTHDLDDGLTMIERGLTTHLITARLMLPAMIERDGALVVEVTDGVGTHYRGSLFYDFVKAGTRRLAFALNSELAPLGHTAVAVTPGFLRSEAMLDHFGVTAQTWREGIADDPHFAQSESPRFVGRAIAALAADPRRVEFGGQVVSSGGLGQRYDLTDIDDSRPNFSAYAIETLVAAIEAIETADRADAFATEAALSNAVGDLATPFVSVGGDRLLARLRGGDGIEAAVRATVVL